MSPEYEKADVDEMLRQLQKYFAPPEDSQQNCPLCGETLIESAVVSDKHHTVCQKVECEDNGCPYIEQDIMVRREDSEWVIETPPWPEWNPDSYDGSDEKLVWLLIALQAMQENSSAPRCRPRTGNPNWLSQ